MSIQLITEMASSYRNLEKMSTLEIVASINNEDKTVPLIIEKLLPAIENLIDAIVRKMNTGARLFYIGAGTSGRLGVLDASECPPTYGVSKDLVVGIMAGGDDALRYGIEDAEDNAEMGWKDLQKYAPHENDVLIGLAASGTTPYVLGALKEARLNGLLTGCIVCNPDSPIAFHADYPIEIVVGPEFVTGSTRMKCGTAQKMVLNMISTAVMIKLGKVEDNKMIHMEISNSKLIARGVRLLMELSGITDVEEAKKLLIQFGDVHAALKSLKSI